MLGFEMFLIASAAACMRSLDRERYAAAVGWSLVMFLIKATGVLMTAALIAYFAMRLSADLFRERRFSRPWAMRTLSAGGVLAAEQGLLWWSGAFEQQQGGRLPLVMAFAWFPDLLALAFVALVGWLLFLLRPSVHAPASLLARSADILVRERVLTVSAMMIVLTAAAITGVRFVPRYAAFAALFVYAILPVVLLSAMGRQRTVAVVFAVVTAVNLGNWNGALLPDQTWALEHWASFPGSILRREGSLLERSHEYLPHHRENLMATRAAVAAAGDQPVVTSLPYSFYLALPEVGVVERGLTVYSTYPVGPESISRIKSIADFERDRPASFVVLRDRNALSFAFNRWEIPLPRASNPVVFRERDGIDLVVYRQSDLSATATRHADWIARAASLPTLAWVRLWSAERVAGGAGAYAVAKELSAGSPLSGESTILWCAAAARIGQWQDVIDAALAAEARQGILSDPTYPFARATGVGPSALKRSLDALAAGDERRAAEFALQSAGQDAPFLPSLVGRYRMALALLNEGSGRQAAPVFRELLEHVPQFWPAELGLAKVDWQLGNIDQAKTILETLIEKQPTAAEPVRLLAILLADSHPGLSRDVLERYLERFPDADQVRDCLAELELAEPISTQVEQTSGGSP
jgi:hypothetical protein